MALWWRQTKPTEANNNPATFTDSTIPHNHQHSDENSDPGPTTITDQELSSNGNLQLPPAESGNLELAPYVTPYRRLDGAVERIVSVALSALIAVLLAWRFLLSDGSNNSAQYRAFRIPHAVYLGSEGEEDQGSDDEITRANEAELIPQEQQKEPNNNTQPQSVGALNDRKIEQKQWATNEARKFPEKTPINRCSLSQSEKSADEKGKKFCATDDRQGVFDSSGLSTNFSPSTPCFVTTSTSSTRRPLGVNISTSNSNETDGVLKNSDRMNDSGIIRPDSEFSVDQFLLEEASVDSISSDEERGTLPAYLDTISEEDTDDLLSLSSGMSQQLSPKLPPLVSAEIQSVRERLAKNQQDLDTNHNNLTPLAAAETKAGGVKCVENGERGLRHDESGSPLDETAEEEEEGDALISVGSLLGAKLDDNSSGNSSLRSTSPDSSVKSDDGDDISLSDKDSDERTILTASDTTLKASSLTELDDESLARLATTNNAAVDNIIAANDFFNGHATSLTRARLESDHSSLTKRTGVTTTDSSSNREEKKSAQNLPVFLGISENFGQDFADLVDFTSERTRTWSPDSRFSRAYQEYFEKNSNIGSVSDSDSTNPSKMEHINLSESMKKFAHYGKVYGDARSSVLEELKPKKEHEDSSSSRSSSLVSEQGVPMEIFQDSGSQSTFDKPATASQRVPLVASQIPVPSRLKGKSSSPQTGPGTSFECSNDAAELELGEVQTKDALNDANGNPASGTGLHGLSTGSAQVEPSVTERDNHNNHHTPTTGVPPNTGEEFHSVSLLARRPVYCTTAENNATTSLTAPPNNADQDHISEQEKNYAKSQPKGAIFSLGQQLSSQKGGKLTATAATTATGKVKGQPIKAAPRELTRPITRRVDLSPTVASGNSSDSDSGETVVIASATSRLVSGDKKEKKILSEASANAVSKSPYVALARATASAASKLSANAPPPSGNDQKVSVVVASTVSTTKTKLSSPKSRLSSVRDPGITTTTFGGKSAAENLPKEMNYVFGSAKNMLGLRPDYGGENAMNRSSSRESLTMRTVTESVTYKRTTMESPVAPEMLGKNIGTTTAITSSFKRSESPERKRPTLLQQNQQQTYYREETTHPHAHSQSFANNPYASSREKSPSSFTVPITVDANQRKDMSGIHETPTRSRAEIGYRPEPQRILPPSQWVQEEPVRRVVSPSHISSENIQRMVEDPYYDKGKSRETLFSNQPSTPSMTYMVEKVSDQPPSRGSIYAMGQEPSVPLSQENVSLWASLPENTANSKQNLMRWRNSMHLDENEVLASLMAAANESATEQNELSQQRPPSTSQLSATLASALNRAPSPYSVASSTADSTIARQRVYQRQLENEQMENARSSRRAKYRAKIEKARSDYITSQSANGSVSDLYKTPEDFQRKFQVSMEEIRRPPAQLRGPLLQKFHSPYFNSKVDLNKLPPTAYARMPASRYDKEYNEIVARAERLWAAYKNRITPPKENLYSRSRAYSASYLETNVDTGEDREVTAGEINVEETDLEDVHRSGHSIHSLGAARQQQEQQQRYYEEQQHQSRGRMREQPEQRKPENRAKSVDYLMDRQARSEIEPPENQLQKILGEPAYQPPSMEVERFRKSTEKLSVPGWYLESEYCPGKFDPNRSYFDKVGTTAAHNIPERPKSAVPYVQASLQSQDRPGTSQSTYSAHQQGPRSYDPYSGLRQTAVMAPKPSTKAPPPPPHGGAKIAQDPSNQSRYVSPWTYGGRFSGPHGTVQNQVKKVQEISRMTTSQTTNWNQKLVPEQSPPSQTKNKSRDGLYIPSDFFDKYREEIEELRKSRTSLLGGPVEHSSLSGQLPVAAVKPRPIGTTLDQSSSTMSSPSMKHYDVPPYSYQGAQYGSYATQGTNGTTTGGPNRPSTIGPFEDEQDAYGMGMVTSTPRNSDKLPRKAPVPTPRTSVSRDQSLNRSDNYEEEQRTMIHEIKAEIEANQRQHQGWTVSAPPPDWDMPRNRDSRVIEVTDTFVDARRTTSGDEGRRLAGNVTLEEVLDSLLALPSHQNRLSTLNESSTSLNTSFGEIRPKTPSQPGGPAIYTQNYRVMEQCERSPERAEQLLKHESLYVQCDYCGRTKELSEARGRFVSCRHCYIYYCTRVCRRSGWDRHKAQCTFARVNTTCKEIILKVREDPDAQWQMSRVARQGNTTRGRGSVNFRFRSLPLAETYVNGGWKALNRHPGNYLYYYTVPDLVEGRKDPNLIALCRRYDPRSKFILSVSIVADVEECPETPPPERNSWRVPATTPPKPVVQSAQREAIQQPIRPASELNGRIYGGGENSIYSSQQDDSYAARSKSLPKRYLQNGNGEPDAKTLLKSVLRSMENIAPGEPVLENRYGTYEKPVSAGFDWSNRNRHTVDSSPWRPGHYQSTPLVYDGKLYLGQEDDGTDV